VRQRVPRFEGCYGRAPAQRELAKLAQASNFATRKGKARAGRRAVPGAGAVGWADRLARTLGVPLSSVAPSVWHADAHSSGADPDAGTAGDAEAEEQGAVPGDLELARAAQTIVPQPPPTVTRHAGFSGRSS
jgi:hypothetical protein